MVHAATNHRQNHSRGYRPTGDTPSASKQMAFDHWSCRDGKQQPKLVSSQVKAPASNHQRDAGATRAGFQSFQLMHFRFFALPAVLAVAQGRLNPRLRGLTCCVCRSVTLNCMGIAKKRKLIKELRQARREQPAGLTREQKSVLRRTRRGLQPPPDEPRVTGHYDY